MPIATLPGMRDRTITISSGGKTFSFTGWKVGWVCASPELTDAVKTAKQFLTYVNAGPFQHAIAVGLALGDDYYEALASTCATSATGCVPGSSHGRASTCIVPHGTYFVTTDIRPLGNRRRARVLPSVAASLRCRRGAERRSSTTTRSAGSSLVRWACCKRPEVLDEAVVPAKAALAS